MPARIRDLPRVATIATMASRAEGFRQVLPAIRAQVGQVFVYLDFYDAAPAWLLALDRVTVHRAEAVGDLHASSRFLCLEQIAGPAVVVAVDDDILYPPDYVDTLVGVLDQVAGQALVGVHGRIFTPPHRSYTRDAATLHFAAGLPRSCQVHELGAGTCAFVSDRLALDPRRWDRTDMDDITLAIEAQRRGLARVAVARAEGWLRPLAENQPDSLWSGALRDDAEQSRRMRALLALYAAAPSAEESRQTISCSPASTPEAGT